MHENPLPAALLSTGPSGKGATAEYREEISNYENE
jgi:hypothetical protein